MLTWPCYKYGIHLTLGWSNLIWRQEMAGLRQSNFLSGGLDIETQSRRLVRTYIVHAYANLSREILVNKATPNLIIKKSFIISKC